MTNAIKTEKGASRLVGKGSSVKGMFEQSLRDKGMIHADVWRWIFREREQQLQCALVRQVHPWHLEGIMRRTQ